ncbi:hypothetical protein SLE2022_287880 [Rubroshorea leprosula]
MFFILLPTPLLDSAFDSVTISSIAILLLLSLLSLTFIFHLQIKSRRSHYLQRFNSLWTVRFLLVSFITFWVLNEHLRFPFFRRRFLYPFPSSLTLSQQANLCKIQLVLSLGFFEPGFLVTLLFLVDVSIKKKTPHGCYATAFVLTSCLPILLLQIFFVFFSQMEIHLPEIFLRNSSISKDSDGNEMVVCAYPLLSTIVFGAFSAVYLLFFLLSFWKVVSIVINKALRKRIRALAFTVMATVPLQVLFMGLSVLWRPEKTAFSGAALIVFLTTFVCAAVGEGILVIRPIADSLAAGGECCGWSSDMASQSPRPPVAVEDGCAAQP